MGSGAGGGPLAANLAQKGYKVCLLEAGSDPCAETDLGRYMYEVPIFHGLSTEYPEIAWDYYVRHYTDQEKASKRTASSVADRDGIWYPRAGTLGGCTAHNAMITVVPQDSDWNHLAESHRRFLMARRKYAAVFRNGWKTVTMLPIPILLAGAWNAAASSIAGLIGHARIGAIRLMGTASAAGFQRPKRIPSLALNDSTLLSVILRSVGEALRNHAGNPFVKIVDTIRSQ